MAETYHGGSLTLDEALTAKSAVTRSLARMSTSTAQAEILRVINAELNRPDCPAHNFLQALAEWFTQIHASVAAQVCEPDMGEVTAELWKAQIDRVYADHFNIVLKTDFRKGAAQ
jgi:hypothetical protein